MAGAGVDIKYDEELVKRIQELFVNKIVPENFLLVVHKYDLNVLTMADIQRLRKSMDSKTSADVNYDLLITMKNYKGWFDVILKVCKDSDIKQEFLVNEFMRIKRELDEIWFSHQSQQDQLSSALGKFYLASNIDGTPSTSRRSEMESRKWSSSDFRHQVEPKSFEIQTGGYCYLCSVELNNEKFKDMHISSKAHQKKVKDRSQNTSIDETPVAFASDSKHYIIKSDGTGECKICDVKFTSNQDAIHHLEGSKHKKNIEALQAKSFVKS